MSVPVLIDAGPLVAMMNRRDEHHAWALAQMRTIIAPLNTCEAALAVALHLLEQHAGNSRALRQWLARGVIEIDFSLRTQSSAVFALMDRYAEVPMSLADACLVRMCELDERAVLFTTDSDFLIYRKHRQTPLPVLLPART